jgi:hypothetical protein
MVDRLIRSRCDFATWIQKFSARLGYYWFARHPGTIGEMWSGSHFQTTEHQAGSHGRRASRSAGAGPATSRIVPWPNIPKMTYATEIANTGASPGA